MGCQMNNADGFLFLLPPTAAPTIHPLKPASRLVEIAPISLTSSSRADSGSPAGGSWSKRARRSSTETTAISSLSRNWSTCRGLQPSSRPPTRRNLHL
ncbi:hypothetical protein LINPERHAP1_LOCUS27299 [Linum perenne]